MVVIRLTRGGAKKRPFYHIVVADRRKPRDGGIIERVGYFNPVATGKEIEMQIDLELVDKWVKNGAQMTDRVKSLVKEFKKNAEKTAAAA